MAIALECRPILDAGASRALAAGDDYQDHGAMINGIESQLDRDCFMTMAFNIASRCPVMSVPSGLSRDGVPTGLQIAGRTYDDVSVFNAAAAFERLRPWPKTVRNDSVAAGALPAGVDLQP